MHIRTVKGCCSISKSRTAENVKMGMTQRAREGKFNSGRVLGYQSKNKELIIVLEEAEIDGKIVNT